MAEVTAALVKELRDKTGAGMMDCKRALSETGGDIEAATDWLRAKGLSKAAKKADRAAAEGLVAIAFDGVKGAAIELNSETDFVARNESFQTAAAGIAKIALTAKDHDALLAAPSPDGDGAVSDLVTRLIATIGENITLRRSAVLTVSEGVVVSYVHNAVKDGMGRIGVLVALESGGAKPVLEELGRKIAMHIAALNPISLSENDIPAERLAREKAIIVDQTSQDPKAIGKPQQVIDKMIEGRMRKFFEESVLVKQVSVHAPDGKQTIEASIQEAAKAAGAPIALKAFVRFEVGDGVEKRTDDFAAEVAALSKQPD